MERDYNAGNSAVLGGTRGTRDTGAPPAHCLGGVESTLSDAVTQVDQLYERARQAADSLLGGEPQAGENAKCSPIGSGRIGGFEDRLVRLHHLLGVLSCELARIERAIQ